MCCFHYLTMYLFFCKWSKSIYEKMDKNDDGKLTKDEFDMNAEGTLTVPEHFRVWGNWPRE